MDSFRRCDHVEKRKEPLTSPQNCNDSNHKVHTNGYNLAPLL